MIEGGKVVLDVEVRPRTSTALTIRYAIEDASDVTDANGGAIEVGASGDATISLSIVDDDEIEDPRESLVVELTEPTAGAGYRLGTESTVTVEIEEGVCDHTPAVRDEITKGAGQSSCRDVTLSAMERLTGLSLHEAEITELKAEDFSNLPNLEYISLDRNRITSLPPRIFDGLSRLESLYLDSNPGLELESNIFSGLANLRLLSVMACKIEDFPEGVFSGLNNLRSLTLSQNPVSDLPLALFDDLRSLEWLEISNMVLNTLNHRHFESLGSLEELIIQSNEPEGCQVPGCPPQTLTFGPNAFGPLSSLTKLNLRSNRFDELPDDLFAGLHNLEELLLRYNSLDRLPESLYDLPALRILDLHNSGLREVGAQGFQNQRELRRLILSDNQMADLPPAAFRDLTHLEELRLDGNPGTPFSVGVALSRTDADDVLAPGPATVALRFAQDALFAQMPFDVTTEIAAQRGGVSSDMMTIAAESKVSDEATVTQESVGRATYVYGPTRGTIDSADYTGLRTDIVEPLVLFAKSSNRLPVAVGRLPRHTGTAGLPLPLHEPARHKPLVADIRNYFRDDDGDDLAFRASSDNERVAGAEVTGSSLVLRPIGAGETIVKLIATDEDGLFAAHNIHLRVRPQPDPSRFNIDIVVVGERASDAHRAAVDTARRRWEELIIGDVPDVELQSPLYSPCGRNDDEVIGGIVDDILVYARYQTGGNYGVGRIRRAESRLTTVGCLWLSPARRIVVHGESESEHVYATGEQQQRTWNRTAIHELTHALGFHGAVWDDKGLLRDPPDGDLHVAGPLAVEAFDNAGGTAYSGPKVPVARGRSNSHWRPTWASFRRDDIIYTDIMVGPDILEPWSWVNMDGAKEIRYVVSPITVQIMADIGYRVDVSRADEFEIPPPPD